MCKFMLCQLLGKGLFLLSLSRRNPTVSPGRFLQLLLPFHFCPFFQHCSHCLAQPPAADTTALHSPSKTWFCVSRPWCRGSSPFTAVSATCCSHSLSNAEQPELKAPVTSARVRKALTDCLDSGQCTAMVSLRTTHQSLQEDRPSAWRNVTKMASLLNCLFPKHIPYIRIALVLPLCLLRRKWIILL